VQPALSDSDSFSDGMREAIFSRSVPRDRSPVVAAAVSAIVNQGGPTVRAILFFGSRKSQAGPDSHSPWDFMVLVDDYRDFYLSLEKAGALHRSPALLWRLNRILPPSVIALRGEMAGLNLKCPVFSMRDFARQTSISRHDHFLLGRLFQPVEIVYANGVAAMDDVVDGLVRASLLTFAWGRSWLHGRFDAATYCKTLLRISYGAEIRPEPSSRIMTVWQAQGESQLPVYSKLLAGLRLLGELDEPEPGIYSLLQPVTWGKRVRNLCYFRWSLVRSTMRWWKHVITFQGWLDFIVYKARRHSGQNIVLTPRERRFPLILLWPRVIRYLREKNVCRVPQA
jgi:hypothetical protein